MEHPVIDEDAMIASIDLVHRTGATSCEFGHNGDDDDPNATWWAQAMYRGARVIVDDHRDPIAALEALARRLLHKARCVGCNRTITLEGMASKKACRWTRNGREWVPGCTGGQRRLAQRRAKQRTT